MYETQLIPTTPVSKVFATRKALVMSLVKTPDIRPYLFAIISQQLAINCQHSCRNLLGIVCQFHDFLLGLESFHHGNGSKDLGLVDFGVRLYKLLGLKVPFDQGDRTVTYRWIEEHSRLHVATSFTTVARQ